MDDIGGLTDDIVANEDLDVVRETVEFCESSVVNFEDFTENETVDCNENVGEFFCNETDTLPVGAEISDVFRVTEFCSVVDVTRVNVVEPAVDVGDVSSFDAVVGFGVVSRMVDLFVGCIVIGGVGGCVVLIRLFPLPCTLPIPCKSVELIMLFRVLNCILKMLLQFIFRISQQVLS